VVQILNSLGIPVKTPITLHVDNMGAIFMAENTTCNQRTRHIDVKHHFLVGPAPCVGSTRVGSIHQTGSSCSLSSCRTVCSHHMGFNSLQQLGTLVLGRISSYVSLIVSDPINAVCTLHIVEEHIQLAFIVKGLGIFLDHRSDLEKVFECHLVF